MAGRPHRLSRLGAEVGERLTQRRETLAIAESSAGGVINAALVAVPGASRYYRGGAIIYTAASRQELLGIGAEEMKGLRSATEPMAELLARRMRGKLGASWGLAETGAAGPAGNRYGDAPGHACIAVSGPVSRVITVETGSADREANMRTFAERAIELLRDCLAAA